MNRKEKDKAVRDYLEQTVLQHLTAGVMIVDARTHIIENVNPAAATLFGAPADQIVGRQCHDFVCPAGEGVCPVIDLNQDLDNSFRVLVRADRSSLPILKSVKKIQLGGKEKLLEVFLEMSEFKKTEEALRESEERYRTIFESFVDIYYQTDLNCTITELSPSVFPLTGWRPEELVGTQVLDVYHDPAERTRLLQELAQKHAVNGFEMLLKKKDGTPTPASVNARMLTNSAGEPTGISGTIRDITEQKKLEDTLRRNEARLKALLSAIPDMMFVFSSDARFIDFKADDRSELLVPPESFLDRHVAEVLPPDLAALTLRHIDIAVSTGGTVTYEYFMEHKGAQQHYESRLTRCGQNEVLAVVRNITQRKRAEQALRENEQKFRMLAESASSAILIYQGEGFRYVNPAACVMTGYSEEELMQMRFWDLAHPDFREQIRQRGLARQRGEAMPGRYEFKLLTKSGQEMWVDFTGTLISYDGEPAGLATLYDITDLKNAERALRASEEKYRSIFESFVDIYFQTDLKGTITELSPSVLPLTGWRPEELVGTQVLDVYHDPADRTRLLQELAQKHAVNGFEMLLKKKDGTPTPASVNARMLKNSAGEPTGISGTIRDITERKNAELRIESQLQHLRALNAIDLAIASTFDLRVTFSVLLERVVTQLRADAAAVLLFDPYSNRFECAAQRGFRNSAVVNSTFRLGDDLISTVVRDRRGAGIADGTKTDHPFIPSELAAGEDFVGVQATPLIAKGKVNGALVVFRRSLMSPGPEWFDFYRTVADQTAVAIDNARLFDDLQSANLELIQAYDATIEGWSAALDLRDKETEGHSQRVTQMTVDIARTMGIRHVDLVHIRRGALLHDIGKMGVPDAILLKADPLTDEEWTIMRRHPEFAYQLLSPIPYLQPALDIPYCHHERWDGSGYPRGLKGKAIPVAARIFSVVDAWDALRSDRPYRAAWPAEQAREHIRKLAGTHFDPDIVRLFLGIVGHDTASL